MRECMKAPLSKGLPVSSKRKKTRRGRVYLKVVGLTGVHAPPEDMAKDDDLLFLDFLEAVVLVRVLIAIEAAQTNAGRQTVELLHPQLTVVVDRIQVAINDVANAALARVHTDGGAITQHRQHAVAAYGHAFGLIELHTVMAQAALAEAQTRAFALFDDESS